MRSAAARLSFATRAWFAPAVVGVGGAGLLLVLAWTRPPAGWPEPSSAALPTVLDDFDAELLLPPPRPSRPRAELLGRRVLVHFWTEDCADCAASLAALDELCRRFAAHDFASVAILQRSLAEPTIDDAELEAAACSRGWTGDVRVAEPDTVMNVSIGRRLLERGGDASFPWSTGTLTILLDRHGTPCWSRGEHIHRSDDPAHAECARALAHLERTLDDELGH